MAYSFRPKLKPGVRNNDDALFLRFYPFQNFKWKSRGSLESQNCRENKAQVESTHITCATCIDIQTEFFLILSHDVNQTYMFSQIFDIILSGNFPNANIQQIFTFLNAWHKPCWAPPDIVFYQLTAYLLKNCRRYPWKCLHHIMTPYSLKGTARKILKLLLESNF